MRLFLCLMVGGLFFGVAVADGESFADDADLAELRRFEESWFGFEFNARLKSMPKEQVFFQVSRDGNVYRGVSEKLIDGFLWTFASWSDLRRDFFVNCQVPSDAWIAKQKSEGFGVPNPYAVRFCDASRGQSAVAGSRFGEPYLGFIEGNRFSEFYLASSRKVVESSIAGRKMRGVICLQDRMPEITFFFDGAGKLDSIRCRVRVGDAVGGQKYEEQQICQSGEETDFLHRFEYADFEGVSLVKASSIEFESKNGASGKGTWEFYGYARLPYELGSKIDMLNVDIPDGAEVQCVGNPALIYEHVNGELRLVSDSSKIDAARKSRLQARSGRGLLWYYTVAGLMLFVVVTTMIWYRNRGAS